MTRTTLLAPLLCITACAFPSADLREVTTDPEIVQLDAGSYQSCMLRNDGTVECFDVMYSDRIERDPNAPFEFDELPLSEVSRLDLQYEMGCALHGTRFTCWEERFSGGFGDWKAIHFFHVPPDPKASIVAPAEGYLCWLDQEGRIHCRDDGPGFSAKDPPLEPPEGAGYQDLTTCQTMACAINTSGGVECWGEHYMAVKGEIEGVVGATQLESGDNTVCARGQNGSVWCWGRAYHGEMGDKTFLSEDGHRVSGIPKARDLAVGNTHVCIAGEDGSVWCWGRNQSGQMGPGVRKTKHQYDPVQVQGISGATAVAAGASHSCALLDDGRVVCWGAVQRKSKRVKMNKRGMRKLNRMVR